MCVSVSVMHLLCETLKLTFPFSLLYIVLHSNKNNVYIFIILFTKYSRIIFVFTERCNQVK